jgi:hypothetical protein
MFARKIQDITGKKNFVVFSLDGDYRIDFESWKFFDCFQTEWASPDISPEGTLTFHVGENYGDPHVVIAGKSRSIPEGTPVDCSQVATSPVGQDWCVWCGMFFADGRVGEHCHRVRLRLLGRRALRRRHEILPVDGFVRYRADRVCKIHRCALRLRPRSGALSMGAML